MFDVLSLRLARSQPSRRRAVASTARQTVPVRVAFLACLTAALAAPGVLVADWPSMRGPSHDGGVDAASLFEGETGGLEVTWKVPLGSGYSGVVVGDDRVYALFAAGEDDVAAAFDTATGEEIWRYRIAETYAGHDGSHDGPIATPALGDGVLVGFGPRGQLFAVDTATGAERWVRDLATTDEAQSPWYGFSSSPVIVGDTVVVGIGAGVGKAVAGYALADGERRWNLGGESEEDGIQYQSPIVTTLGGREQVVALTSKALYGIDPTNGETLWSHEHGGDERAMGAASGVAIPAGDDRLLVLYQQDASAMFQYADGALTQLWSTNSMRGTYVQPVIHDGVIYGMTGRIFTAVDAATGERLWRSRDPGDGFPTRVGDHLVVVTKPGTLHVVAADPEGYREIASLDLFDEHAWAAVAYADGALYARSMNELARVDPAEARAPVERAEAPEWVDHTAFGEFLASLDDAPDRQAAVDAFLAEQDSLPLVEPTGAVHFLFQSEGDDVGIVGAMIGYRREDPMVRVEGTDLFHYSARLEPDAAVSYGFLPDFAEEAVPDPHNPRSTNGLFGAVSFVALPGWQGEWVDLPEPPANPGAGGEEAAEAPAPFADRLVDIHWESAAKDGQTRHARVYLPAGYEGGSARHPVAYVHMGGDPLHGGALPKVLDAAPAGSAEPTIVVFVLADTANMRADVGDLEAWTRMVADELVPKIDAEYRTRADAGARASVGFTRGANRALEVALARPDVFGKAAIYWPMLQGAPDAEALLESATGAPLAIVHRWGRYHIRSPHEAWDMADGNRALWTALRERGYSPTGGESADDMSWTSMASAADDWLPILFPAP